MEIIALLTDLERKFWLEGAAFYREHLADDFTMLFPGVGVMDRAEAIAGIEQGPRWTEVEIHDAQMIDLSPDNRVLYYKATARREGEETYSALVSSVYVHRESKWKLIFHQQSPVS